MVSYSGCGRPGDDGAEWAERTWRDLSLRERVAQTIIAEVAVPAAWPDSAVDARNRQAIAERVGGVIPRGGNVAELARTLGALPRQGQGQIRLLVVAPPEAGTEAPTIRIEALSPADLRRSGRDAAHTARAEGVHLIWVPNTAGITSYLQGLVGGEVLAAVSAIPAREPGALNGRVPVLLSDRVWLETAELPLLRAGVEAGVGAILLPPVAIPALSGDTLPLPFSPAVASGLLRRDLNFEGLALADLSRAGALVGAYGETDAAVRSLAAGVDLLVGVAEPTAVIDAVVAAVEEGRLQRARVNQASLRVLRTKGRLQLHRDEARSRGSRRLWGRSAGGEHPTQELRTISAQEESAAHLAPMLQHVPAAEAGMSEAALRRVDGVIRGAVEEGLFPGAALAVGRRGRLVRLQGYGHLSREPDAAPVEATTLYDLASLTKVVGTTAAAMALIDDGRLELDAPVQRYIPEWLSTSGNGPQIDITRQRVTVRHLLTHMAGLPAGLAIHARAESPADAMRRVIRAPLTLDPGAVSLYSDLSMILLAEVVSRAAGEPLDRLLARRVFRPMGMASTMYLPPLALHPRIAPSAQTAPDEFLLQGIVHDGTAFRLGGVSGHAGIFSNARDLAAYAQTLLNGGAYGPSAVFSPATVTAFRTRQPGASERALGWDTPAPESSAGSYFSAQSFGHTGFTGTSLWIDPEKELFVVLLTNRTYDRTSLQRMLVLRQRVHEGIARAIVDAPVRRRPGAVDIITPPRAR
ncbi:MAG: serine hydrolase [Gemmatimonadetes bacterium]|nr:serine hydrolase [Gemmatimonadota bacterium]